MINNIPTLDGFMISKDDLQKLNRNMNTDKAYKIFDDKNVRRKIYKLRCSYAQVALYIMYTVEWDMNSEGQLNFIQLAIFSEILHRMISLFCYSLIRLPLGIWYISITIDALISDKLSFDEIDFKKINEPLFNYCIKCYSHGDLLHSPEPFIMYKNVES